MEELYIASLPSGENLMECYQKQNAARRSPTMKTTKLLHSENKDLENSEINGHLEEVRNFLEQPAVEKTCNLSQASWVPDLKCAKVVKKVGKKWNYFGHSFMGNDVLYPEEAAYLLEINDLEIMHAGIPMSLQKCFALLLTDENGCNLLEYRVYSHLVTFGYRVFRHDPELISLSQTGSTEKRVEPVTITELREERSTCEVQVTSNCMRFETRFTLDQLKSSHTLKTFRDLLYESRSSAETNESCKQLPVLEADISDEEEEETDDDIVLIEDNENQPPVAKKNGADIEILTLDSSDDETQGNSIRNDTTCSASKTTANCIATKRQDEEIVIEDFISLNSSNRDRNKFGMKVGSEEVVIEEFIPFNGSRINNVNVKAERRDTNAMDFIAIKRLKTEETSSDRKGASAAKKRRKNKRQEKQQNLKVAKHIFQTPTEAMLNTSQQGEGLVQFNNDLTDNTNSLIHMNNELGQIQLNNGLTSTNNVLGSNVAELVQGAVSQLSQAMAANLQGLRNNSNYQGNHRGSLGYRDGNHSRPWGPNQNSFNQNSFPSQNRFPPPNGHGNFTRGFYNRNNQTVQPFINHPMNGIETGTPIESQSELNPSFNQLSQLNQLLDGINSNIQRSVSGLYRLKRLQDPNYRPMYRRPRPPNQYSHQGGGYNNGPRYPLGANRNFNQFNQAGNQYQGNQCSQYDSFNQPRFPQNFTPHQQQNFQQPLGNNQNMHNNGGFQVMQEQQLYGLIGDNSEGAVANESMDNGRGVLNGPNVKKEMVNTEETSSEEESESDEEESEEEVKPNIAKTNSSVESVTLNRNEQTQSTTNSVIANIKQENQAVTSSVGGQQTNTHIRFKVERSSSEDSSSEEDEDTNTNNTQNAKEKVVTKNLVPLGKLLTSKELTKNVSDEDSSSEESSSEDEDSTHKGNTNKTPKETSNIPAKPNVVHAKKLETTSEEESTSGEDGGKESTKENNLLMADTTTDSDEETEEDSSYEADSTLKNKDSKHSTEIDSLMLLGMKKRTHIRFNVDSDDETDNGGEKVDEIQKDVGATSVEMQSDYSTDEELERENEKLIIFHSEIIPPEARKLFIENFSNDPLEILKYIYSANLSHARIKLLNAKIMRAFKNKEETSRKLLHQVLKREQNLLKKRRYLVRKRLLRRANKRQTCKTYIGTILSAPKRTTPESDGMESDVENEKDNSALLHSTEESVSETQVRERVEETNDEFNNENCDTTGNETIDGQLENSAEKEDSQTSESFANHNDVHTECNEISVTSGENVENQDNNETMEVCNEEIRVTEREELKSKESIEQSVAIFNEVACVNNSVDDSTAQCERMETDSLSPEKNIETEETHNESCNEKESELRKSHCEAPSNVSNVEELERNEIHCAGSRNIKELDTKEHSINKNKTDSTDENKSTESSSTEKKISNVNKSKAAENISGTVIADSENTIENASKTNTIENLTNSNTIENASKTNTIENLTNSNTIKNSTNSNTIENLTNYNTIEDTTSSNKIENPTNSNKIENTTDSNKMKNPNNSNTIENPTNSKTIENSTESRSLEKTSPCDQIPSESNIEEKQVPSSVDETKSQDNHTDKVAQEVTETGVGIVGNDSNIESTETVVNGTSSNSHSTNKKIEEMFEKTETIASKDTETESLLQDEKCSSYGELYNKLNIFNKGPPVTDGDDQRPLKISFDVYCATGKNFSKTKRGAPNYRVIVVQPDQELPSPSQMSELQGRYSDTQGVPYLFAVVLPGSVSMYRYSDVFIPFLLEQLD